MNELDGRYEVFVSYSGRDNPPSFVENALTPTDPRDAPKCMRGKNLFFDKTGLYAHDRWPEKLKHIASNCQVLVVVVGQNWAEQLIARRKKGYLLPDEETDWGTLDHVDWVMAELYWALKRERPAHLVICYWGNVERLDIDRLFPAELSNLSLVRKAFKEDNRYQFLKHTVQADNPKLAEAVEKGMQIYLAHDVRAERAAQYSGASRKQKDRIDPFYWLNFLDRANQWKELEEKLDAQVLGGMSFPEVPGDGKANSVAFLWGVESEDDACDKFAKAVNHHLYAKGDLVKEAASDCSTGAGSVLADSGLNVYELIARVLNKLAMPEQLDVPRASDIESLPVTVRQKNVSTFVQNALDQSIQQPYCIYFSVRVDGTASSVRDIEELHKFLSFWNSCDWSGLNGRRLAILAFAEKANQRRKWWQFRQQSFSSFPDSVIGKIDTPCVEKWRRFVRDGLGMAEELSGLLKASKSDNLCLPAHFIDLEDEIKKETKANG